MLSYEMKQSFSNTVWLMQPKLQDEARALYTENAELFWLTWKWETVKTSRRLEQGLLGGGTSLPGFCCASPSVLAPHSKCLCCHLSLGTLIHHTLSRFLSHPGLLSCLHTLLYRCSEL